MNTYILSMPYGTFLAAKLRLPVEIMNARA